MSFWATRILILVTSFGGGYLVGLGALAGAALPSFIGMVLVGAAMFCLGNSRRARNAS